MLAQRFGLRPGRGRNRILDAVEQSLLQALQAVRRAREDQQE
ncbi:GntR family transcriptional regulator [Bordetella pertussis]|nr:GntR family transcriptional regulator [Bordetella pertussis]